MRPVPPFNKSKISPTLAIIVGDLSYGMDLTGVDKVHIKLRISNKLLYSRHADGFDRPHG